MCGYVCMCMYMLACLSVCMYLQIHVSQLLRVLHLRIIVLAQFKPYGPTLKCSSAPVIFETIRRFLRS